MTLGYETVVPGAMQVQRLQRFATYGYLKQVVLKMIAADLAVSSSADLLGEDQCEAISMVTALRSGTSTVVVGICDFLIFQCFLYLKQVSIHVIKLIMIKLILFRDTL